MFRRLPRDDPFRQPELITLRVASLVVIPGHPFRRLLVQLLGLLLQLRGIVERIRFVQLPGVDQGPDKIADTGAVICPLAQFPT